MSPNAIQQMLDEIADVLGLGVTLDDLGGRLVAYSTRHGRADEARIRALLDREVPAEVRAWENRHGSPTTGPVELPANPDLGMLARLGVPLLHRGVRTGVLWIQQTDDSWDSATVAEQVAALAEQVDTLAAVQYQMTSPQLEHHRHLGEVFHDACRGGHAAAAELAGWSALRSGRPTRVVVCLHGSSAGGAPPNEQQATQLSIGARQILANTESVIVGSVSSTHTTALVRIDPGAPADTGRELHRQLAYAVGSTGRSATSPWTLHTGVSSAVTGADAIPAAYREARVAAQVAAVEPELGSVTSWEEIGPYRFLADNVRDDAAPRSAVHDLLHASDPAGELATTLEVYYDLGDSVARTADRLHLHRTTLYYRLRRIKEIIGRDPLAGFTRLELHLAFKALRWADRPRI
jgi:PucR family transcriptional regulator, proline-responsive transcriptional activator